MNAKIWLFADHIYNPSYWLILKREGFSGNIAYSSAELTYDIYNFDRDALAEIYRIHHGEHPNNKNRWQLHFEVEHLILSGRVSVFVLDLDLLTRVGDPFDPLMNESQGFYDSGTPIVATRNQLAEELGKIIGTRWLGKDNADQLHWDRSVIARVMVERYDMGAAVVDTAVDVVVGLWEIGKFVVTLAAGVAEFKLQIIAKVVTGDFEGIKDQLLQLGIDSVNSVEDAIAKAKQGFEILQRINNDPQSKALIYDFFDSLYQSIHYRDTRTMGIRIITVIGIEVLIALATAGAGNVARIAAMSTAKLARGTASAAKHIGPFTLKSIDLLGDLAKRLKSNTLIPDEQLELPPVKPIEIPESGKLGIAPQKNSGSAKVDLDDVPGSATSSIGADTAPGINIPKDKQRWKYENRTDITQRTADDVNKADFDNGYRPPYRPGTQVTEFTTKADDQFVRVHGDDNAARPWMMRKEAIDGLTAEQIQQKYSLPSKPTLISDVDVPAGTRMRVGKVETNFELQGGGGQGATQYEWIGTRVPGDVISNTRLL